MSLDKQTNVWIRGYQKLRALGKANRIFIAEIAIRRVRDRNGYRDIKMRYSISD